MKNKKFLLLPALALMLCACNNGSGNGSGVSGGDQSGNQSTVAPDQSASGDQDSDGTSYDPNKQLRLDFYLDYNHYDKENPYYSVFWYYDDPFTKEAIGLTDPDPKKISDLDPFYPNFKGWSRHAVVDEDSYLWKFGQESVSKEMAVGGYVEFFGIFTE